MIEIHADGSAKPNNGRGHCGGGVIYRRQDKLVGYALYFGIGTNNMAELRAIKFALENLLSKPGASSLPIKLYTDSEYAMYSVTGGWVLRPSKKNYELIKSIQDLIKDFSNLEFEHEAGHTSGNVLNKWADELASEGVLTKNAVTRYERQV